MTYEETTVLILDRKTGFVALFVALFVNVMLIVKKNGKSCGTSRQYSTHDRGSQIESDPD